jgi:hypothetical protein
LDARDAGVGRGIGVVHRKISLAEIEKADFSAEFACGVEKEGEGMESRGLVSQAAADAEEFEAHAMYCFFFRPLR